MGQWPFDEGSGTTALDATGNGNNGTLQDGPTFVDGRFGQALAFEGSRVAIPASDSLTADLFQGSFTLSAWINPKRTGNTWQQIFRSITATGSANDTLFINNDGRLSWRGFVGGTWTVLCETASDVVPADQWTHAAVVGDGTNFRIYVNGALSQESAFQTTGGTNATYYIGGDPTATGESYSGMIDDVRIYDHALSAAEIKELIPPQLKAFEPSPEDGAIGVTSPLLQWKAGDTAAQHDVYLGTDPDALEFMVRYGRLQTVYYHQAGLTPGTTYYWRIDEVEADETTIHAGDVWSFSVPALSASKPDPPDGAKWIQSDVTLSWSAGWGSIYYQVYLSADLDAVTNGTTGADKGIVGGTSYAATGLDSGTTYYWRVDAFDDKGAWHTGDVWSFTAIPIVPITDPNLVAWWKLDEGEGSTVVDWSGHYNHGTFAGNPQWVPGYDGGALELDGSSWVDYGDPPQSQITEAITIACWINPAGLSGEQAFVARNGAYVLKASSDHLRFTTPGILDHDGLNTILEAGTWQHVAATFQAEQTQGLVFYLNGVETERLDSSAVNVGTGPVLVGNNQWGEAYTGLIDDVRLYNKVLTQQEIKQAMRGDPLLAWDPSPVNGSTPDIDGAIPLTWSPGEKAAQHDVYFGTDETAVKNADASDTTGIYRVRQAATSYTPPEALQWGQTYYWRVDEVNSDATISQGRVWTFTVADYLIVDDFERYDDYCDRIFYAWKDGWGYSADPDCGVTASTGNGTGSTVGDLNFPYAEQTIVHSGNQSMPFEYNNTGTGGKARYSEASLEFASARDWIRWDVKGLSLWFHGETGNTPETLYVGVEDSAGQVRVATHPNREALQVAAWQEWNIDLQQFGGVNLASVKKFYLGVGNRTSPTAGGTGKLYIDDIRVYRPRCLPDLKKPPADLTDDCTVDYADLQILTNNWLISTYQVIPAAPGTTGLAGHWTFDNAADLGADSTGNNNGTIDGDASQSTNAQVGSGSLALDGDGDFLNVRGGTFFSALDDDGDGFTVAAWVQFAYRGQYAVMRVFSTNMSAGGSGGWGFGIIQPPARVRFTTYGIRDYDTGDLSGYLPSGQWVHVAAVYKSDGDVDFYIDGSWAETVEGNFSMNDTEGFLIGGLAAPTATEWFEGLIDDLHIYDRELSQGEVGWLAGKTAPYNHDLSPLLTPRNPAINGYDDGTIDLKDYAVMADQWLDEVLWP